MFDDTLFKVLMVIAWTLIFSIAAFVGYEIWLASFTRAKWLYQREKEKKWKDIRKFIKKL